MPGFELDSRAHLPLWPAHRDVGIGVVGAGFIVRDCHLVAYAEAGFPVVGITSRTLDRAHEVADATGDSTRLSVARGDARRPGGRDRRHRGPARGAAGGDPPDPRASAGRSGASWRRSRWRCRSAEARELVDACAAAGVVLQVNQNMRYDHSVRACRHLLDRGVLGEPVLATIEMRAIPHWMPWARDGRSLSTFVMSIHHLDTFRYWLGDPDRVLASTRPDPRTTFPHADGINLYILEYASGARASSWDDVWSGPAREGAGADIGIRWRFEGTDGLALGTIGWPGWPRRVPSTHRLHDAAAMTGPGIARGGPRPGFPTPSPAPWPGCSVPSRRDASRTSRAGQSRDHRPLRGRPARRRSIAWYVRRIQDIMEEMTGSVRVVPHGDSRKPLTCRLIVAISCSPGHLAIVAWRPRRFVAVRDRRWRHADRGHRRLALAAEEAA